MEVRLEGDGKRAKRSARLALQASIQTQRGQVKIVRAKTVERIWIRLKAAKL